MKSVGARPVDVQLIRSILSDYAPDERELAEHWDEMARILARILDVRDVVHMPAFVFDSLLSPGPNPSKTQMITLATKRKGEGTDFHFDPTLRLRDIE